MNTESYFKLWFLVCSMQFLTACAPESSTKEVKIALNPWPGYEFLFLAQEKGFFQKHGLDIKLIEMSSLADVQRIYVQGRADGMASTLIEVVQAAGQSKDNISVLLISDYSNGDDAIITSEDRKSISELKGKRIGTEIGSLGMYLLALALEKEQLALTDVDIINVEQLSIEQSITQGEVDAVVTYPPFSLSILKHPGYHQIFDSSMIPASIIDTISIRTSTLKQLPSNWKQRFYAAWDEALEFSFINPNEAFQIMADQEGISSEEFVETLKGLRLFKSKDSNKALQLKHTRATLSKVCDTLKHAGTINAECEKIVSLVMLTHNY